MKQEKWLNRNLPPQERAALLLKELSTAEKMNQLNGLFFNPLKDRVADIRLAYGHVSTLELRRIKTLREAAYWQRTVQKKIMENSPHRIPAIFHMEGICGAYLPGAASFPSGIGRGSSFDPELEYQIGRVVSRQETALGITQILAPVLDIARDPRMGRHGEAYGEDPVLAGRMGTAFTQGLQAENENPVKAEAAAKHFCGFHSSLGGIHGANCEISDPLMMEVFAKPFQMAITEAGLKGIMPCYSAVNGKPVSASRKYLTGILREQMGFEGMTISDYGAVANVHKVQKLYRDVTEAGQRCLMAGMDVELPGIEGYNKALTALFESGKEDQKILNQAVLRVLTAKFRMGIFEHPFAAEDEVLEKSFCRQEEFFISLQSARESVVLLKNEGILPLDSSIKKIAVIGCMGDDIGFFFGGYTHMSMAEELLSAKASMAGVENTMETERKIICIPGTGIQCNTDPAFTALHKQMKPECRSFVGALREAMPECEIRQAYGYPYAGNDTSGFEEALQVIENCDLAILTLGGKNCSGSISSMGEGVDGTDIGLPFCQEEFIRRAAELHKPMIGIHFNGRPISSDNADKYLAAILEAWNPAEFGGRVLTEILTGKMEPVGRMPVSTAYCSGQIPVYYNHPNGSQWHQGESIGFQNYVDLPHKPRYAFGYGLSYTTFAYRDLTLNRKEVSSGETVTASVYVKNTGNRPGSELVQLYLRDVQADMIRPERELAGFVRVELGTGEEKEIRFRISPEQLAYYDEEGNWMIEAGMVDVLVGASSSDIRAEDSFMILDTCRISGKDRTFYADAEVIS